MGLFPFHRVDYHAVTTNTTTAAAAASSSHSIRWLFEFQRISFDAMACFKTASMAFNDTWTAGHRPYQRTNMNHNMLGNGELWPMITMNTNIGRHYICLFGLLDGKRMMWIDMQALCLISFLVKQSVIWCDKIKCHQAKMLMPHHVWMVYKRQRQRPSICMQCMMFENERKKCTFIHKKIHIMIPFKLHRCFESLSLSAPHFPSIQSHLICA